LEQSTKRFIPQHRDSVHIQIASANVFIGKLEIIKIKSNQLITNLELQKSAEIRKQTDSIKRSSKKNSWKSANYVKPESSIDISEISKSELQILTIDQDLANKNVRISPYT
jgi:hypothetical protein